MAYIPYENYVDPSERFNDKLQQQLMQNAALKRQSMLDQMNQQYKQAQAKHMEAQTGLAQQQMELSKTRLGMEQQKMDEHRAAGIMPGDVSPENAALAEKAYPGSTTTTPGTPGQEMGGAMPNPQDYGPAAAVPAKPATTIFRGDPAYQRQQIHQKEIQAIVNDPSLSDEQKMYKLLPYSKDPGSVAERYAGILEKNSDDSKQVSVIDPKGNVVGQAPKGSIRLSYPPTPPPAYAGPPIVIQNADGTSQIVAAPRGGGPLQGLNPPAPPQTEEEKKYAAFLAGKGLQQSGEGVGPLKPSAPGQLAPGSTAYHIGTPPKPGTATTNKAEAAGIAHYEAALKSGQGQAAAAVAVQEIINAQEPAVAEDVRGLMAEAAKRKVGVSTLLPAVQGTPEHVAKVTRVIRLLVPGTK